MAILWVENVIVPFLKFFFVSAFVIWIFFMFYYAFIKIFNKNRRMWFKYSFLKRQPDEETVEFCVGCVERNMTEFEVRAFLLKNGNSLNQVEEVAYIFNETLKQLKGGDYINGRLKKSNRKTKFTAS